ncbi:MAG: hypothetical protein JSV65_06545 [Armatimonadota bacterium]|nr:MAG: hypothetical protein JSV65_06545 [Armatimonadota bacterium]
MTVRLAVLVLSFAFGLTAAAPSHGNDAAPVPLGRFAQPSLTGVGHLCNLDHNVIVERGFKLLYLAPERHGERFGKPTFAGFVSLLLNGRIQAHTLVNPDAMGEGTRTLLAAPTLGRYAKDYCGGFGQATVVCEDAIGNPVVRFSAECEAADKPVIAEWLVTGWEWAGQPVPAHWEWWGSDGRTVLRQDRRGRLRLPVGDGFLLAWNEGQPYTLALLPASRPTEVRVGARGVTLRFAESRVPAGAKAALPDLYAAALGAHAPDSVLRILPLLACPADELVTEVASAGDVPFVRFRWSRRDSTAPLPIPPPFSAVILNHPRRKALRLTSHDTVFGPVALAQARSVAMALDIPPNLERLTEDFPPVPADDKAAIEVDVKALLAHENDDGTFTFSLERPFYDGQTAGVLIQLAPLLDEPLRGQVVLAVRKTLDYWWGRLTTDERTGVVVFPEPVMPSAVVDYPEISSTVLYPTAAYAALVDPDYAAEIWPKAASLAATVGRAYDITGSAWAHAGPEYVHVLTESTVGGYLAYACLYHLARLAGEPEAAADFRARACWAFAAMDLYRWREAYGRGGILSQYFGDGLFVEPAVAWDYTMFTWFSWCPLWSLPPDDPYHVFEVLRQQRWWLYWRDSRQLAYDFSHFMALVRFGDAAEGLTHWDEILTHEPSFDNFDTVALYRPLARAWKQVAASRE